MPGRPVPLEQHRAEGSSGEMKDERSLPDRDQSTPPAYETQIGNDFAPMLALQRISLFPEQPQTDIDHVRVILAPAMIGYFLQRRVDPP